MPTRLPARALAAVSRAAGLDSQHLCCVDVHDRVNTDLEGVKSSIANALYCIWRDKLEIIVTYEGTR